MQFCVMFFSIIVLATAISLGQCRGACGRSGICGQREPEVEHCHWLEVEGVVPNSLAERGGVRPGDTLFSYGGRKIGCRADLAVVETAKERDSAEVLFRGGRQPVVLRIAWGQDIGVYLREWRKDVVPAADARIVCGVPPLDRANGEANSLLAALESWFVPFGQSAGYALLSGLSGAAFQTRFADAWPKNLANSACECRSVELALYNLGVLARRMELSTDGKNREILLAAIKQSVDSGIPVVAGWGGEAVEWGVITGYQSGGEEFFCRTLRSDRKGYDLASVFPRLVLILNQPELDVSLSNSLTGSLRAVLDCLVAESCGGYWSGLAAFDHWMERLRGNRFELPDGFSLEEVLQANHLLVRRLVVARRAGVDYLRQLSERYLPTRATLLDELARVYAEEVDVLGHLETAVPQPGEAAQVTDWSLESREMQIAALRRVRRLEEQALFLWCQLAEPK